MSRIYSARLWVASSQAPGTLTNTVGTPGDTVVIRSMDFYWGVNALTHPGGFELRDSGGTILFRSVSPVVAPLTNYHYDGRQVLAADNTLVLSVLEAGWHWWISGYNLSP